MKKTICALVAAVGLIACAPHEQYHFDDKIGEEQVTFWEENLDSDNFLRVTKPDGSITLYKDLLHNDLKVDRVTVVGPDRTDNYRRGNEVDKPVMEAAQKKFDSYLQKITEERRKRGLEALK